ncbi:MAG TPA: hypothetical protein VFN53_10390 [Acidobacteriaceae bacterium]|nr:hypothetical protein [Acidobacteriaceae bacterium]
MIPFEYVHGHIFLQLALGGLGMHTVMLDTGFTSDSKMIAIDSRIAEQLRTGEGEPLQIAGLGTDDIHGRKVDDIDVRLGGTAIVHSAAESFDFTALRVALRHPLDGIIGFAFLRDYVAEVDYSDRVLRLHDAARYRYRGAGTQISMDRSRPIIRVRVQLPTGEEREAQLLIDTGSDAVLILDPRFIRRHGPSQRILNIEQSSYIGLGGRFACDVVELSRMQFGDNSLGRQISIQSFYALLAPLSRGVRDRSRLDGDLGNKILEHMDVIFDPRRERVILELPPMKLAMR